VRTLEDWLSFIERQHPHSIALGLERVAEVFKRMQIRLQCPIITVGGTNGKGSTCAMLESILRAAGHRTGVYTSPHLVRYNERVRIAGAEVEDAALVAGFEAVEKARGDTPLTSRLTQALLIAPQSGDVLEASARPWYVTALQLSEPLHFGDYGGLPLKILWGLLDILTIVVLGSGLYLWLKRGAMEGRT